MVNVTAIHRYSYLKMSCIEFAWKEYYADAIHSAIVNPAG